MEIAKRAHSTASGYAWIEFFFAACGSDPLLITFEETVASPAATARHVLDFAAVAASEPGGGRDIRQRPEIQVRRGLRPSNVGTGVVPAHRIGPG